MILQEICKGNISKDKEKNWKIVIGLVNVVMKNRIKVIREHFGISQQTLAELCGVSRNTISSLERGEFEPRLRLALRIEEVFNFLGRDEDCIWFVHDIFSQGEEK